MTGQRIEVNSEDVELLVSRVRRGEQIPRASHPVAHAVVDALDLHRLYGPYPMSAKEISEAVGFTSRSIIRQRSRRRNRARAGSRIG